MKKIIIQTVAIVALLTSASIGAMVSKVQNAISSGKYTKSFADLQAAPDDKVRQALITKRGLPFTLADYKAWQGQAAPLLAPVAPAAVAQAPVLAPAAPAAVAQAPAAEVEQERQEILRAHKNDLYQRAIAAPSYEAGKAILEQYEAEHPDVDISDVKAPALNYLRMK